MSINHIFIFTDTPKEAADELLSFGFEEGSSRVHPGQGTRNRKFYFQNFYLELLYVHNESELKSEITAPTKLYERSQYKTINSSPFGLCLDYDKKDALLFDECLKYKPNYLPPHMEIEVIPNEEKQTLPWVFRWQADIKGGYEDEPLNPYQLTKAIFHTPEDKDIPFIKNISHYEEIEFIKDEKIHLTLELNKNKEAKIRTFEILALSIKY